MSRAVLSDLAETTGIGRGNPDAMSRCFDPLAGAFSAACRPFENKFIITAYAPVVNGSDPTKASLNVQVRHGIGPTARAKAAWVGAGYRLLVERGAGGWKVVSVRDTVYFGS